MLQFVQALLERFRDVCSDPLNVGLPPMRDIFMDLVPGAQLPNLHYHMAPSEH